jgi:hypothetical protein
MQFLPKRARFAAAEIASSWAHRGAVSRVVEQNLASVSWHRGCTRGGMLIKVYNGTLSHTGQSLCESCRHATITRGHRFQDEIVRCEAPPMTTTLITFKVTECSAYMDARLPTYSQLLEQAWILRPTTGRRPAGFVRSSELRDEEFRELMADLRDA